MPQLGAWPQNLEAHHIIVIGAGIGGLAAGALLALKGYKVLVCESHYQPGGNCTSWARTLRSDGNKKTFVFDAGVQDISGLGPKGPVRNLLTRLQANNEIEWKRVQHAYWRDGLYLKGSQSSADFVRNIGELFPDEKQALYTFFAEMEHIYHEMFADIETTGGIPTSPTATNDILSWPETHPHAFQWMKKPYETMLNTFFANDTLKHLLTTLSEYIADATEGLLVEDMAPLFGYYLTVDTIP